MRARLAAKVLNAAAAGRTVNRRTLARAERRLGWRALRLPRVVEQVGAAVRGAIEASSALVEAVAACAEALSGMASAWGTMAREATRAAHATGCADRGDAFVHTFATGGVVPRDGAYRLADRDAWRGLHFDSDDTAPLTEGEVLAAIAGLDVPFRHELPPVDFESIQRRIANGTPDYLLWPSLVDLDVSHGTPVGLGVVTP